MSEHSAELKLLDVQRRFDHAAESFSGADFVHRITFDELLQRLSPIAIQPKRILDLGSAVGKGSRALAKHFKRSRVFACDTSFGMLQQSNQMRSLFRSVWELQGNALQIPLQQGSVDLVFANLLLPWIDDLQALFKEIARVLRKDGVFAFSTLGPDSLSEIREAWHSVDNDVHVNAFPDMHNIGDALVQSGLKDPILDVDRLTITYRSINALYQDLSSVGARNSLRARRQTLTGRNRFQRVNESLLARFSDDQLPLHLELVYGHAWGNGVVSPPGEFHLDPALISRRKRP